MTVAAAWLLWPPRRGAHAALVTPSPAATTPVAPSSAIMSGPADDAPAQPHAVPVADVANAIDLLALALRGGVGLVEAVEAAGDDQMVAKGGNPAQVAVVGAGDDLVPL